MIEFGQPLVGRIENIGLPIIAHMAYRRVSEKRLFQACVFSLLLRFHAVDDEKDSDWPLLLLRVLLFVVIMMILADPYWSDEKGMFLQIPTGRNEFTWLIVQSVCLAGEDGTRYKMNCLINGKMMVRRSWDDRLWS